MVTVEDVLEQAEKLYNGDRPPSVKLALWNAACSVQQELRFSCRIALLLRPFVDEELPEREKLTGILRRSGGVFYGRTLDALYYIEQLDRSGKLSGLENIGNGWGEQDAWRCRVLSLVKGHGLSFKCVSFAALLIDPSVCELVPVDRHVLARLDIPKLVCNQISMTYQYYLDVESMVLSERNDENPGLVGALHHWYTWEKYRQEQGHSQSFTCEDSSDLGVRSY